MAADSTKSHRFALDLSLSSRDIAILLIFREVPFLPMDFIERIFKIRKEHLYRKLKLFRSKGLLKFPSLTLNGEPSNIICLDKRGRDLCDMIALNPKMFYEKGESFSWDNYWPCNDFEWVEFTDTLVRLHHHLAFTHLLELWVRLKHTGAFNNVVLTDLVKGTTKDMLYGPPDIVGYNSMKDGKLKSWVSFEWEYSIKSKQRAWAKIDLCLRNVGYDWNIFLAPNIKVLKVFTKVIRQSFEGKFRDQSGRSKEFFTQDWKSIISDKFYFGVWVPSYLENTDSSKLDKVNLYRWDHEIFDPLIWDKDHRSWKSSGYDGRIGGVKEFVLTDILGAYV